MPKKPARRKSGRGKTKPGLSLERLSASTGVSVERLSELESICRQHGTRIEKVPFWLLKKTPSRLVYWFKHKK